MSLLNLLSFDSEKIIWNYFHKFNNLEERINEILNCNYCDDFKFIKCDINLIDFLENYKSFKKLSKYEKLIKIKIEKTNHTFTINQNNVENIIKLNKKILNININQIVKLYESDCIYILI